MDHNNPVGKSLVEVATRAARIIAGPWGLESRVTRGKGLGIEKANARASA